MADIMDLLCSEIIVYESDPSLYRLNKRQQQMSSPAIIRDQSSICSSLGDAESDSHPDAQNNAVVCNMKELVYIYASVDSAAKNPEQLEPPPPTPPPPPPPPTATQSIQSYPRYISQEPPTSHCQRLDERLTTTADPPATDNVNTAIGDPTLYSDRCLENFLKVEEKHHKIPDTYFSIQKDITPPMRKIVAEWMMEVSN